ncbi:MAG: MBL fold metallo-hydrolase RNA specificity domain-containing protein [Candidatus Zixiibacteriota bacterium]
MKITFLGAVRGVTGSMHLLSVNGQRVLIDCGLFQGRRAESNRRNRQLPVNVDGIDRVVLGHAHIDHSGNVPFLVKNGYSRSIYSTFATRDLCAVMLADSAHIQRKDAEYLNKKKRLKGDDRIEALYSVEEARRAIELFRGVSYHKPFYVTKDIRLTFFDAGHILGSALSFFEIFENGSRKTLLYAVDLGRKDLPILRDPEVVEGVDYLILESTYGGRLHGEISEAEDQLADVVNRTHSRGGKIIIPAFSLERTQEIVYCLHLLEAAGRIPVLPVYVDSPLSTNVTQIFQLHPECFDHETNELLAHNRNPFGLNQITYVRDAEASKKLNQLKESCIIISASGMCEAGRILHHLKNNIENPNNTILVVGFMARNTLGRRLVERQPRVRIFGEEYALKAEVEVIDTFSAHADREDLIDYVDSLGKSLKRILLVHGEEEQSRALKEELEKRGYTNVNLPEEGDEIEL